MNHVLVDNPSVETVIISSTGVKGDAGVGVKEGGKAGQVLAKLSDDNFDTAWINSSAMAAGISFEPSGNSFTSNNMQDAIVEVDDELISMRTAMEDNWKSFLNTVDLVGTLKVDVNKIDLGLMSTTSALDSHKSASNNPHNVTASQIPYTTTGNVITLDNVQGAITELESALGSINGGDYLGVLIITSSTSPSLPPVGNSGDYFFLEVPSSGYNWRGFTGINSGDYLISNGSSWEHLVQAVTETDPVFRASSAFDITDLDKSKWSTGYDNSITSLALQGNTLTLGRAVGSNISVDLSKYEFTLPSNIAYKNSANTFTKNLTVQGTVSASNFSGVGTNITKVSPRITKDVANQNRYLLLAGTSNSSDSSLIYTQSSVKINPATGSLTATEFVGDASKLTGIVEDVEIGDY